MAAGLNSRIVVAGAGSIGCYAGGCLALAGRHVTLLLRPALADAITSHGLHISDLAGADRTLPPNQLAIATEAAAALTDADIVLLTVKSGATSSMADLIARHAPPNAIVVSLQNGVGNLDALRAHLAPGQRPVPGMVPFNVVQTRAEAAAPRFHRATSGTIQIASGQIASGTPGLRETLDVTGLAVAEHADMPGVLWGKLMLNLNNALNALSDLPLATQLADRRWRRLLAAQLEEAFVVIDAAGIAPARVEGVPPRMIPAILWLPNVIFRVVARRMLAIDPAARSSMWEDLAARRPTEIDYLQGVILALAEKHKKPAPLTRRITQLIKAAEAAGNGSPHLQPEQIASVK